MGKNLRSKKKKRRNHIGPAKHYPYYSLTSVEIAKPLEKRVIQPSRTQNLHPKRPGGGGGGGGGPAPTRAAPSGGGGGGGAGGPPVTGGRRLLPLEVSEL